MLIAPPLAAAGGTAVESVEAEGRTANEATEKALQELGLRRDQVDVEVLSEGKPRLLGFRGEPARVRVTPKPAPAPRAARAPVSEPVDEEEDFEDDEDADEESDDEEDEDDDLEDEDEEYDEDEEDEDEESAPPAELTRRSAAVVAVPAPDASEVEIAVSVLENLVQLMGLEATVTPREPETAGDGLGMIESVLDVEGDDLGILIGRRGQTLMSLQYVLNLILSKKTGRRVAYGVDVDGYRRRREEALVSLAKRTASRVRGTGRSVTLEPMPPNERRIVHMALADDPAVLTVSIGEGEARKVAITPAR
ncbi:MAG: RNA-binding cell elongation regulator Jag/EloR [Dehalococcoidia bacterium]